MRLFKFGALLCVYIAFLLNISWYSRVIAQPAVTNPSFETVSAEPARLALNGTNPDELAKASPWDTPTYGSPDLFSEWATGPTFCTAPVPPAPIKEVGAPHNRMGWENPHQGHRYAGFFVASSSREYIRGKITGLIQYHAYKLKFWISLADQSTKAVENLGVFVRTQCPDNYGNHGHYKISGTPQSPTVPYSGFSFTPPTTNGTATDWVQVEGIFVAPSISADFMVGSFDASPVFNTVSSMTPRCSPPHDDYPNTAAYYYIDDFTIEEVTDPAEIPCDDLTDWDINLVPADPETGVTGCCYDVYFQNNNPTGTNPTVLRNIFAGLYNGVTPVGFEYAGDVNSSEGVMVKNAEAVGSVSHYLFLPPSSGPVVVQPNGSSVLVGKLCIPPSSPPLSLSFTSLTGYDVDPQTGQFLHGVACWEDIEHPVCDEGCCQGISIQLEPYTGEYFTSCQYTIKVQATLSPLCGVYGVEIVDDGGITTISTIGSGTLIDFSQGPVAIAVVETYASGVAHGKVRLLAADGSVLCEQSFEKECHTQLGMDMGR